MEVLPCAHSLLPRRQPHYSPAPHWRSRLHRCQVPSRERRRRVMSCRNKACPWDRARLQSVRPRLLPTHHRSREHLTSLVRQARPAPLKLRARPRTWRPRAASRSSASFHRVTGASGSRHSFSLLCWDMPPQSCSQRAKTRPLRTPSWCGVDGLLHSELRRQNASNTLDDQSCSCYPQGCGVHAERSQQAVSLLSHQAGT